MYDRTRITRVCDMRIDSSSLESFSSKFECMPPLLTTRCLLILFADQGKRGYEGYLGDAQSSYGDNLIDDLGFHPGFQPL